MSVKGDGYRGGAYWRDKGLPWTPLEWTVTQKELNQVRPLRRAK